MSQEDSTRERTDPELLDRATALNRLLFTRDEDLLREAAQRQERGETFAGVIYAHQLRVSIGQCVQDLEVVALAGEPEDFANRVEYLPLRSGQTIRSTTTGKDKGAIRFGCLCTEEIATS